MHLWWKKIKVKRYRYIYLERQSVVETRKLHQYTVAFISLRIIHESGYTFWVIVNIACISIYVHAWQSPDTVTIPRRKKKRGKLRKYYAWRKNCIFKGWLKFDLLSWELDSELATRQLIKLIAFNGDSWRLNLED